MNAENYNQLGKAWKSTCKVLLGEEVGELSEFKDYLRRYTDPIEKRSSALSGRDVTISSTRVPRNARIISHDEAKAYEQKIAGMPFNINEIKDMESIVEAAREKAYYAGDIVLGNSKHVLDSHRCVNTHYAIGCQDVYDGKYVAYTTSIRSPEYSFGCCFGGDIRFCIKVLDPYKLDRCMELFHCNVVSDGYYSASLEDCTNCMFSFNQRHRNYLIGNVALDKDKYAALKVKLLGEIAGELRKNKTLPSIIDIVKGEGDANG